jgi:hypothetical protein
MINKIYNRRHLSEYLTYGLIAAISYSIPVGVYLFLADYTYSEIPFLGSVLFMFVILIYCIKLAKRRPEYKSVWMMIVEAQFAILIGIVLSVLISMILCFIFIPAFMSGHSPGTFLKHAPVARNESNSGVLLTIFLTATIANFGAAGFMAVMAPYVFKYDQTKDKTVLLDKEISETEAS